MFLQITGEPAADLQVPGRPFTFGQFIAAQAVGDGAVLADHGRPVLRLHLGDRDAGPRAPGGPAAVTSTRPQPAPRPAGPPAAVDCRTLRPGHLRRHRRPGPQEADAGGVRPRQPRPAAARVSR
ncbi:MAG: hypothetical protein WKF83_04510 [Nocardioidaceae bacterium]